MRCTIWSFSNALSTNRMPLLCNMHAYVPVHACIFIIAGKIKSGAKICNDLIKENGSFLIMEMQFL